MSNIKFSFAAIPSAALDITTSATIDTTYNSYDYHLGARSILPRLASNGTTHTMTYDLGASNTLTADHLIIARADILKTDGVTSILLERSSNGSSWTTQHTVSSFSSYALKGYKSDDLFDTFTESSAYRYWRVAMSGSSNKFRLSKISFGRLFDFGVDPDRFESDIVHSGVEGISSSGAISTLRVDEPTHKIKAVWRGVTDSTTDEFYSLLKSSFDYLNCYICTTTTHTILENAYVGHCTIEDLQLKTIADDYNEITLQLKEQIG